MADLSITGEVVVTSEKAEGAFDRVGAKAGQMASKVQAEATKAGAAVDSIGAGAEQGAEKFTRAESRMRSAIQKSTRELEMLGKTASQKFEAQLEFKGLDKAKFQPFLDELRKAEEATKKAESGLSGLGSAAQAAGRAMAVAFSGAAAFGVVGKLVEVQREFDVLNSSLKTVTGSSAAAERELSWLKTFAKETPFGLAQATQGFVKMKALGLDPTRAALTSFGNTASAMGKDLNQMIEAVADASTGEFERLKEFGIKAKKEGDNVSLTFQGVTTTIKNSAEEITKYLENIGNTSFGGAMEERAKTLDGTIAALGDTWDELFRTVSTNNVGSLIFDSVTLANGALEDATTLLRAMGGAAQDASRDTGALSTIQNGIATVFETVAVLGANLKFVLVGIGNEIGGLAAQVAQAAQFNFAGVRAIREQMVADAEAARKEIDATTARILSARKAQEEYARYATRNASAATDPRRVDLGSSTSRPTVPGVDKKAVRAANKELEDQAKLIAELSGLSGSFAADWDTLNKLYAKGKLSLDGLTEAQSKLLAKQPAIAANIKAEEEAWRASLKTAQQIADARNKEIDGIQAWIEAQEQAARQALQSVADRVASLRDEEQAVGLAVAQNISLAEAVEQVALARLQEKQAGFYEGSEGYEAIQKEIAARKELLGLVRGKAQREAATDAAKKAAEEWQRTADDINQSLTEALMRGFESGKDFAENLRDTVSNMFSTLVLRPVISAVMSPVAGAVNGMLYGNAAAAVGGGANALGMLGSGANLITGLQGTQGMLGTVGGWLGLNTVATNAGLAATIGIDAASAAAAANAAGAAGGGLLSGFGAALPWVGGIAALASILGGLDDSGTYHTGGAAQYSGARGLRTSLGFRDNEEGLPSYNPNDNIDNQFGTGFGYVERGDQTISAVSAIAQGLGTALDGVAVAFGQTAGYEIATAFADDTSKDGAWGALRISRDGQELLNWENNRQSRWAPREFGDGEEGYKQYLAAVAKDTRQVLLDMDLPSWADDMLERIGESASMEQLTGVLTQIGVVQSAFVALGKSMEMFSGLTDEMQSGLLTAAGSIDALTAGAGAFYQGFYSEQERVDAAVAQLNETLAGLDLSIDPTLGDDAKAQFRAAVEAAFAAGDADLAAGLLSISGNFASAADYFEQLSQSAADAAAQAADAAAQAAEQAAQMAERLAAEQASIAGDLRRQIYELTGDTAAIRQLEIAGMDAANVALYDRVQALQAEQTAVQATVEASQKAVEAERGLISARAQAAQQAYSDAQAATGAALASIDRSVGAQREVFDASRSAALEAAQEVKSLIDTLSSGIKGLYGEVESARTASAAEGLAFIDNALRNARATGYLPDSKDLGEAIAAARTGMGAENYASQFEADRARLVMAGQLSELSGLAEPQLTAAERAAQAAEGQLKALYDILRNARDQVDAARGIDTTVKTIPEALASLQTAIVSELQAQTQAFAAGLVAALSSGQMKPQDAVESYEAKTGDVLPREAWFDAEGTNAWISTGGATALGGTPTDAMDAVINSNTGDQFTIRTAVDFVHEALQTGDRRSIYDAAVLHGISSVSLDGMMGWTSGTSLDWAKSQGLPAFAVGTNYVPQDMAAIVHKGEAIVPAAYNPAAGGMAGSGNAEMLAELRALRQQNERLEARLASIEESNSTMANLLDNVTEGGNAMRSEVMV